MRSLREALGVPRDADRGFLTACGLFPNTGLCHRLPTLTSRDRGHRFEHTSPPPTTLRIRMYYSGLTARILIPPAFRSGAFREPR